MCVCVCFEDGKKLQSPQMQCMEQRINLEIILKIILEIKFRILYFFWNFFIFSCIFVLTLSTSFLQYRNNVAIIYQMSLAYISVSINLVQLVIFLYLSRISHLPYIVFHFSDNVRHVFVFKISPTFMQFMEEILAALGFLYREFSST